MQKLLSCIMDIGEQLLTSGAEVHRVEDSVERMCVAYGATRTDVFIITSSMMVTIYVGDETYTQTRRIHSSSTNFEKIHLLNDLCRTICNQKLSVEEIRAQLKDCQAVKTYPLWLEFIAYGVISGAFALFFGGGLNEMATALVMGAAVRLCLWLSDLLIPNKMFSKFFSSAVATTLALCAVALHLIPHEDNVMIGIIMTLIPGIGFTNALRDLFTGDSIAGLLRSIEAVLTALAIAAGYFLVVALGGMIL